jgi:N6-L-threonylcarbamoyladenine synthase
MSKSTTILAIESSCDDTSIAVLKDRKVLSNIVSSQKIHELYGGVVPELASRAHQKNIIPTLQVALETAKVVLPDIDVIAFTNGPGLLGSLLVGNSFAKGLSIASGKPLIEVNHMTAHVLAHFIENEENKYPTFPFLCLTVSGGHTQIVLVKTHLDMEVIGKTIDDAAGEAFDKAAKILGLPYPGGPLIDKYAKEGDIHRFTFTKSKMDGLDYSFSGIKTAFLYFIQKEVKNNEHFIEENLSDICASIQHHIVETLLDKLLLASKQTGIKQIALAGGVSANSYLRKKIEVLAEKENWHTFIPAFQYCTDNGAMIGITAYYLFKNNLFSDISVIPNAKLKI